MIIKTAKKLSELKDVLMNTLENSANLEEIVYWVFTDINGSTWKNMTITRPEKIGIEFPKTYGHYHATSITPETYKLITGKGIFMLQRKHYEGKKWIPERVDEVYFIVAEDKDDTIVVPPEYGHSWSNVGTEPLVTFDDWKEGHTQEDYDPIKNLKGMAYYLTEQNGKVEITANPHYKKLPKPQWVSPKEFAELQRK